MHDGDVSLTFGPIIIASRSMASHKQEPTLRISLYVLWSLDLLANDSAEHMSLRGTSESLSAGSGPRAEPRILFGREGS